MRKHHQLGISLLEVAIVLSILSSLAILAAPTIAKAKRDAYVLQCKAQMQEVGTALVKYRIEHSGKMPMLWGDLVPKYIDAKRLICPFTESIAPETVRAWQKEYSELKPGPRYWSSHTYFQPERWDELAKLDKRGLRIPYSDVMKQRGPDTPMLICRDHREPYSLDKLITLRRFSKDPSAVTAPRHPCPYWDFSEDDIVVARWDGRVDTTKKGGTLTHDTFVSTSTDLLEL